MGYFELNANIGRKAKVFQEAAKEFGHEVMRPAGIELDKLQDPADVMAKGSRLWDVLKKSRELGFHKLMIPRAYGGLMGKAPDNAMSLVAEQMGYADAGLAISMEVASMPFAFAVIAPDARVRNWAREYAEDLEANMVGCWAITEPDHGTDWVMGITREGTNPKTAPSLKAVKKGDEYILNGRKSAWVSNGTIATHAVLHVGLDQSKGMHGAGLAMCPLDLPGISKGKPLDKIGQRPLNQGEIIFEEVKLHQKYMIIPVPGFFGGNILGATFLGVANSQMGLTFSGLARAVFDEAFRFAKENTMSGAPLIEQQNIRLKLFNMFMASESARLFAHTVTERLRSGRPNPVARAVTSLFLSTRAPFWAAGKGVQRFFKLYEKYHENEKVAALVKRFSRLDRDGGIIDWGKYGIASKILATETAFNVASEAMQIFGGKGLTTEYPIEKMFRDARASLIEDGANESLALAAAESL
ncbi:MAG TPA: acyl-CoA dehydrogenase family protein [bacterium]|nr:acyl-CoA dehydrogenase family protein [bacterium]